jgi:hypothetical protein
MMRFPDGRRMRQAGDFNQRYPQLEPQISGNDPGSDFSELK